jgi:hypothetical protein
MTEDQIKIVRHMRNYSFIFMGVFILYGIIEFSLKNSTWYIYFCSSLSGFGVIGIKLHEVLKQEKIGSENN